MSYRCNFCICNDTLWHLPTSWTCWSTMVDDLSPFAGNTIKLWVLTKSHKIVMYLSLIVLVRCNLFGPNFVDSITHNRSFSYLRSLWHLNWDGVYLFISDWISFCSLLTLLIVSRSCSLQVCWTQVMTFIETLYEVVSS